MLQQEKSALCVGLSELQAHVRAETGEEEALLASLLRAASEMCEEFIRLPLLMRAFEQRLRVREGWTLVGIQPVRQVTSVRLDGQQPLSTDSFRVDIDHDGRAWLAGLPDGTTCIVSGLAGIASEPNGVPEPIRQGIIRLAAHLFTHRDTPGEHLPAVVTALWRPYRRASLCQ